MSSRVSSVWGWRSHRWPLWSLPSEGPCRAHLASSGRESQLLRAHTAGLVCPCLFPQICSGISLWFHLNLSNDWRCCAFFMRLFAIYVSCLGKRLFKSFGQFFLLLLPFCHWNLRVHCLFWTLLIYSICFANIFSQYIACPFVFLIVSFKTLEFLISVNSMFYVQCCRVIPKNPLLDSRSRSFSPVLPARNLICFNIRSIIHSEITFVCMARCGAKFNIFTYRRPQHPSLKRLFLLSGMTFAIWRKSLHSI